MSDTPHGPGWWMADDGRWYAPERRLGDSTAAPPPVVSAAEVDDPPTDPDVPAVTPTGGGRRVAVLVAAAVVVALLGAGAALVFLGGDDDEEVAANRDPTTTTEATTTTADATTTTATVESVGEPATTKPPAARRPTTSAPPPPAGATNRDPALLPSGLFCRDLAAQDYSYAAAVEYWRIEGMPDRMDADRNGIPCETVYPPSDVAAYWPATAFAGITAYDLPSGLFCRDLAARGVGVYDALLYYILEGYPTRMDADNDGIPCETVYPDATEVWLREF